MHIIKIKYAPGVKPILQAHPGEWFDLRAAETVTYKAGDEVRIPLGVAMKLPWGWEAKIEPRSSTGRLHHLIFMDSGVIDRRFCGDTDWWGSTWYATRDGQVMKNERICQFRLRLRQPRVFFWVVTRLLGKGRGGYGSSGRM